MPDGSWQALPQWDAERLMRLFRERLLAGLVEQRAISKQLVGKLLAWRHPGFSAHVGEPIAAEDKKRLEDTAAYLVRNPLSLKKLVYLDGQQAVLYRSRMNHRTLFYGEYSSRVRGTVHPPESDASIVAVEPAPRRRCPASWARLIAKVYHVDPLVCVRRGQRMSILAFVSDQHSMRRIVPASWD